MNCRRSAQSICRARSARARSISKPNFPACLQGNSTNAFCVTVIGEIERPESFEAELEYKSLVAVLLPSDSFDGHNLDMAPFSKFHIDHYANPALPTIEN